MVHQLRISNDEGKAVDKDPYFFFKETSPFPFSCTSWNFAGNLWVRLVAVKSDDPRKLWMSDPYKVTASSVSQSFKFGDANKALYTYTVPLRCVKDVEPPLD